MKSQHTPEPRLPDETNNLLASLNTTDPDSQEELTKFICALAAEGWPPRTIAGASGLSRTAVSNRLYRNSLSNDPKPNTEHKVPPFNKKLYAPGVRPKKLESNLTAEDRLKIRELHDKAKNKTRWSTPTSPENIASEELDQMILKYVRRKVSLSVISKHMGVTRRAVAQRIEKFKV